MINRVPSRILNHKTPLNCLKQWFPHNRLTSDLPLKIFGCTAFLHVPNLFRSKLEAKAEKGIFIGYASNQKGYRIFNPTTKKVQVSMEVVESHLQGEKNNVGEDETAAVLERKNSVFPEIFIPYNEKIV